MSRGNWENRACVISQTEVWQRVVCPFWVWGHDATMTPNHTFGRCRWCHRARTCTSEVGTASVVAANLLTVAMASTFPSCGVCGRSTLVVLPPLPLFLQSASTLKHFHLDDWPHQCYHSVFACVVSALLYFQALWCLCLASKIPFAVIFSCPLVGNFAILSECSCSPGASIQFDCRALALLQETIPPGSQS